MRASDRTWDVKVCVTSAYDADGFLGIQVDAEGSESTGVATGAASKPTAGRGGVADYEVLYPGGVMHRPLDATLDEAGNVHSGQGCPVQALTEGGRTFVIPLMDPRTVALMPTLNKGDRILPGDAGAFIRVQGSGPGVGRISTFTTDDGTTNGNSVYWLVWPDRHEAVGPWGHLKFDPTGFHLLTQSGARFDMGGMFGLPGIISALTSYVSMAAASISLEASAVVLGGEGPLGHQPVCLYNPALLAWMGQIQAALSALAAAVAGFTGIGTFPALPAAAASIATIVPPLSGSASVSAS